MDENATPSLPPLQQFVERIGAAGQLLGLFEHLPATYFYVKDEQGHFVHVNSALLGVLGLQRAADAIGKTDHDLFLSHVADRYRVQDHQVMQSGQAIVNQVCSVPDARGVIHWYVETKTPLFDAHDRPIGVAGVMYDLAKAGALLEPYERLSEAITHMTNNFADRITLQTLAALSHLSVSQFKRVFKQLFHTTPHLYLNRIRISAACSLLRETSYSTERIADQTGFYDASHFVRQFRAEMHQTPKAYRDRLRIDAAEIAKSGG